MLNHHQRTKVLRASSLATAWCVLHVGLAAPFHTGRVHAQELSPPERTINDGTRNPVNAKPAGDPRAISDWALAGTMWSDAHLVRTLSQAAEQQARLASSAGDGTASEATPASPAVDRYQRLQVQSDQLIRSLEAFGWQRIAVRQATDARQMTESAQRPATIDANAPLPDPAVVGQQLRERLSPSARATPAESPTPRSTNAMADPPTITVPTTEPISADALTDDELEAIPFEVDIAQERVVDSASPVPEEYRTREQAIEDGVQNALAAGIDNFSGSMGTPAGRMTERQMQTQSTTMPYASRSIYDQGAYTPAFEARKSAPADIVARADAVNDALSPTSDPPSNMIVGPNDDLTEPVEPIVADDAIQNEDDLLDEITTSPTRPSIDRSAARYIDRFAVPSAIFEQDAAWVEFRLQANQERWRMIQAMGSDINLESHLEAAIVQLRANALTARRLSTSTQLNSLLDQAQQ